MFAALPYVALGLWVVALRRWCGAWRLAGLVAATVWGAAVVGIVELASAFEAVNTGMFAACWGLLIVATIVAMVMLSRKRRKIEGAEDERAAVATAESAQGDELAGRIGKVAVVLLALAGVTMAVVLVQAVVGAPNNTDSMTYHLARIAHWVQNRSVAYYPTHILRQLQMGPGAEFAMLHFQVLYGGDRLDATVQWLALIGCAMGASWVARQLGARPRGQALAALFCLSLPMALLQAATTMNDLVAAAWLLAFVAMALEAVAALPDELAWYEGTPARAWAWAAFAGMALGLALLTKATSYVFAFPVCCWLGYRLLRRAPKRAAGLAAVLAVAAVLPNSGYYARNVGLFGTPLGPSAEGDKITDARYPNDTFGFSQLASNVLRSAAVQLTTPWPKWNRGLEQDVRAMHRWVGADPDDPTTTWAGQSFKSISAWGHLWANEDLAANPLHLVVVIVAMAAVWMGDGLRRTGGGFSLAVLAAFLLFCGYLRWQPWHSRLHVPLFMLWAPVVGLVLERVGRGWVGLSVLTVLLGVGGTYAANNFFHPLWGPVNIFRLPREQQYFLTNPGLLPPYAQIAAFLHQRGCKEAGLDLPNQDVEYQLWIMTQAQGDRVRFEHVNVKNVSRLTRYSPALPEFRPCYDFLIDTATGRLQVTAPPPTSLSLQPR